MIAIKNWTDFENEIISGDNKFYLYGAGLIYKKIITYCRDNVTGIIDIKGKDADLVTSHKCVRPDEINENSISVLFCLNPLDGKYKNKFCQVVEHLKRIWTIDASVYSLPFEYIIDYGVLPWGGKELIIDNMTVLLKGEKRDFLRKAYQDINEFSNAYLQKLYEEPVSYVMLKDEKTLGLPDFDNGLIKHKNGQKIPPEIVENPTANALWMIGDSRVSGMLNENKTTISAYLQGLLEKKYNVRNCGIPGRDIERMVYQIESLDQIKGGDYVLLMTGFYEFDNFEENIAIWMMYIKKAAEVAKKKNAHFLYINLPTVLEMDLLSDDEAKLEELFHTNEFLDLTKDSLKMSEGLIRRFCEYNSIRYIDLGVAFNKRRYVYGQVFINLHHYGPRGNRLIADELYDLIKQDMMVVSLRNEAVLKKYHVKDMIFQEHIQHMRRERNALNRNILDIKMNMPAQFVDMNSELKIGAIVMNANPYTFGHAYLIQEALRYVDKLIIFVLSENRSFFCFRDRFEIVKINTMEYENVHIVPSGELIISHYTFPEYFKKEMMQSETIDAEKDIDIFGREVAPALNIKYRFVGSEPNDRVTFQYNYQLKKRLPQYGIELIEIPRLLDNKGAVISATSVRSFFENSDWESIGELCSQKTVNYLKTLKEVGLFNKETESNVFK